MAKFIPGQSGNPEGAKAGQTAGVADVVRVARRQLTKPALQTLLNVMRDPDAPASAKVRAAEVSLERAWGPSVPLETLLKNASAAELERLTAQVLEMRKKAAPAVALVPAVPVATVN